MGIKAILFDLDGTLLPMDEEQFVKGYFKLLVNKVAQVGYKQDELVNAIYSGINAMLKNDGSKLNIDVFWDKFSEIFGEKVHQDRVHFDEFYNNEFQQTVQFCSHNPLAKEAVETAKNKGFKVVVATNPVFPSVATESRIRFAGLSPDDFEYYTTYENTGYCKPNLNYYRHILEQIGCKAEECLMVGNNVSEDMVAEQLGMNVFLLTDCLVNKEENDISIYRHGDFTQLISYINSI